MTDEGPNPTTTARAGPSTAVAKNAINLVLGQVATTALAIVFTGALARHLGAEGFGIYYLITTAATFAYVFVEWGQPLFVIRQVATQPARGGELLGTALALRVAFALLLTVPLWIVSWAVGYDERTRTASVLFLLASLPFFVAQGYGMIFRAHDRMGKDASVSVANKVFAFAITIPALKLGAGIPGVILGQALAGVAALALAVSFYRRLEEPRLGAARSTARELLVGGAPILAMTAAVSVQPYLDATILSRLCPPAAVGWFGAARTIMGTLVAPAVILGAAAYPSLARAAGDPLALRREVRAALRPLLWLGALAGTGTFLFAGTAIDVIAGDRDFLPAVVILQVFAPGLFLLFVDILLGNIIYATGRGTGFAVAKILSVAVGTGLDLVLIPWFQTHHGNGGIGVVVAFALSEFIVFAGSLFVLRRTALEPRMAIDVGRALGVSAATVLVFRALPGLSPWLGLPACVAVFTLVSLAVRLIDREDLTSLLAVVRRRGNAASAPAKS